MMSSVYRRIRDPLQQKVPKDLCYMLLVWHEHHSGIKKTVSSLSQVVLECYLIESG